MPKTKRRKLARLEEYRNRRGLSVSQLAQKSGVSEQTIRRAEHGKNVTWPTVHSLANALAVLPQTLLGQVDVWEHDYPPRWAQSTWEQTLEQELGRRWQ